VEVVVAITILGIATVGLAGTALHTGKSSTVIQATSARQSALSNLTDRVTSTPFDSLVSLAGCNSGGESPFSYRYCIGVTSAELTVRVVTIMVEPDDESIPADSARLVRTRGTAPTPF
jgi:hypothetical protein